MRDSSPQALLEATECLVREAGHIVQEQWLRPRSVSHKGAIDLVTQTDTAVEAFLKPRLAALLPEATFLGEESSRPDAQPEGLCWIVDPVDGTTNFVHHIPQVGISVALWDGQQVALGVVHVPMLDECFTARRGGGAFCNGAPVAVSTAARLEDALVGTGFPYEFTGRLPVIVERLARVLPRVQGLRRLGAASVDLAYVACGRLDVFYESGLKPWDMAAGWLLVEEAGGRVSNLRGEALRFGQAVLATNGGLHQAATELLAPTAGDW